MTDGNDSGGPEQNDSFKFWLNILSIAVSLLVSVGTGVLIYRLTLEQMRKIEGCEPGDQELAIAALEQTALLGDYSDDEEVVEELVPRRQSDLPPV